MGNPLKRVTHASPGSVTRFNGVSLQQPIHSATGRWDAIRRTLHAKDGKGCRSGSIAITSYGPPRTESIILPAIEPRLYAYMAHKAGELGVFLYALGGTEDHMHIVPGDPTEAQCRMGRENAERCQRPVRKYGAAPAWPPLRLAERLRQPDYRRKTACGSDRLRVAAKGTPSGRKRPTPGWNAVMMKKARAIRMSNNTCYRTHPCSAKRSPTMRLRSICRGSRRAESGTRFNGFGISDAEFIRQTHSQDCGTIDATWHRLKPTPDMRNTLKHIRTPGPEPVSTGLAYQMPNSFGKRIGVTLT